MRVSHLSFIILAAVLFSSAAFALEGWSAKNYLEEGFNEKGELKSHYQSNMAVANEQFQQAPEFIREILLNERIQGKIKMENGEIELIGIELSKEGIKSVFRGKMENPTLQITAEERAVVEILESDTPVDAAVKAFNEGKIAYEAIIPSDASDADKVESNFVMTTKLFFVNIASFMSGFVHNVYAALSG